MRFFRDLGLGVKLSLLFLVVLAVLLISTILLLTANTQNLTNEVGGERIREEVNIIQRQLEEIEKNLIVDIDFLSSGVTFFQAVGRRDEEDTAEIIDRANLSLELDDVEVVDGDGNILVDTQPGDTSILKDEMLSLALSGTRVSAVLPITINGNDEIRISVAAPVVSATGNVLGAVQFSRTMDADFLSNLTFGRERVYLGLLYEGRILSRNVVAAAQSNDDTTLRTDITFEPSQVQSALTGETVIGDDLVQSQGIPHAAAYIPVNTASNTLPTAPAAMMILVGLDEIYSFQNSTLVNTIIVFTVLTLLIILLSYLVLYSVAIAPINALRDIARKMTQGQYDQRIPVGSRDELGQLASTFNDMASAVEQRQVSLQAAREQAERSDQVKSAFLASMSHELRTPLNAVINFTMFVKDGDTGPVNEQQIELLEEVISSARHLLNLINDVLDMSKIEAGSLKLFIEDDISLEPILQNAISTGRSLLLAGSKPIELETDIAPELPPMRGDAQRILQILLNIISNACKFTDEGTIKVSAQQSAGDILIAISDTGPGIAPEDQELVFEAFKQTRVGLHHGGGTGLGMPIARSLAEAHGGRLWLSSEAGKGATFFVSLPVKSEMLAPTLAL